MLGVIQKGLWRKTRASQPMRMIGGLLGALKTGMHVVEILPAYLLFHVDRLNNLTSPPSIIQTLVATFPLYR